MGGQMVLEEEADEEAEEGSGRGGNETSLKMGREKFSEVSYSSSEGLQLCCFRQLTSSVRRRGSRKNTMFSPVIETCCRNTALQLPC